MVTQVSYAGASGPFYDINIGKFPSNFETEKGTVAKALDMTATNDKNEASHVTWHSNTFYTMYIALYYRVPSQGKFKIICPPEIKVESEPNIEFKKGTAVKKVKTVSLKVENRK